MTVDFFLIEGVNACPGCKGAGWVNTWVADDADRSGQSDRREDVECPECGGSATRDVDSVDLSEQGRNRSAVLGNTMQALTEGGVPFVKALDAALKAFDHPPAPDGVDSSRGGQNG